MKSRLTTSLAALCIFASFLSTESVAQEKKEAKKKDMTKIYEEIAGDWQFATADIMGQDIFVDLYVESGTLWALVEGDQEPGELNPVDGEELKFEIYNDEDGTYELTFKKDDKGDITKCSVVNATAGFEFEGEKLKKKGGQK